MWQDPVPAVDHPLVEDHDVETLKAKVLDAGLWDDNQAKFVQDFVSAWVKS